MRLQDFLLKEFKSDLKDHQEKIKEHVVAEKAAEVERIISKIEGLSIEKPRRLCFLIWMTLTVGLIFIGFSIVKFLYTMGDTTGIGFGFLGIIIILGVLYYNHLNDIQKANLENAQRFFNQMNYVLVRRIRYIAAETDNPEEKDLLNSVADNIEGDINIILGILGEDLKGIKKKKKKKKDKKEKKEKKEDKGKKEKKERGED